MPRLHHMKGEVSVRNLERKKCPELAHSLSPLRHSAQPYNRYPHPIMQTEKGSALPDSGTQEPKPSSQTPTVKGKPGLGEGMGWNSGSSTMTLYGASHTYTWAASIPSHGKQRPRSL